MNSPVWHKVSDTIKIIKAQLLFRLRTLLGFQFHLPSYDERLFSKNCLWKTCLYIKKTLYKQFHKYENTYVYINVPLFVLYQLYTLKLLPYKTYVQSKWVHWNLGTRLWCFGKSWWGFNNDLMHTAQYIWIVVRSIPL